MRDQIVSYIKWSVFFLLCGRGVLHFTTDIPYELSVGFGTGFERLVGSVLILFGAFALFSTSFLRKSNLTFLFVVPSLLMFLLSVSFFMKANYVPEQIIEHSLQIVLPVLLIYTTKGYYRISSLYMMLSVFVALTFIGHAMFAIGFNYVPDHFVEMASKSLFLSEQQTVSFLTIIGWLDIICAIGVYIPFIRRYLVWYLIVWGILTSIARVYYVLGEGITVELLLVNVPNMVYRLGHGIIPFLMFILILKMEFRSSKKSTRTV